MKNAVFPSKTSNVWKQCDKGQICYPLGSCPDAYETFGGAARVPEQHRSGRTCVHPAAPGLSEQGNMQPWPPGLGQVPNTRPSGRVFLLAGVPLGFSSASHHDPAATTWWLGNIWCKRRGEGGFYQSQSHREEKLSLCLNSAKVAWAWHQQGLET